MRYYKGIKRRFNKLFTKPPYPKVVNLDIVKPELRFTIHSDTEAFRTLNYGGERGQLEYFMSKLIAGDVVYDIGANIGLFSLVTSRVCAEGQVVAFEPDPQIFGRLNDNIKLNSVTNVNTLPYVVSNANEPVLLYTGGNDTVSPSLTGKNVSGLNLDSIEVDGYMLDEIIKLRQLPVPDVLKIDVEGAEYNVLEGASGLLSGDYGKPPRFIFLEVHPDFLVDYGKTVLDVDALLTSHGYTISKSDEREGQLHYFLEYNPS